MTEEEKIKVMKDIMLNNGGYIVEKYIIKDGYDETFLEVMLEKDLVDKEEEGVYLDKKEVPDSYLLLQLLNEDVVFSHMSSLYFHGLSNYFNYDNYEISVLKDSDYINYNNHTVYKLDKKYYNIGLTKIKNNFGNYIVCYDIERSICDIIKNKKEYEFYMYVDCIKNYIKSKEKNIKRLIEYSGMLDMSDEELEIIYIMLELFEY